MDKIKELEDKLNALIFLVYYKSNWELLKTTDAFKEITTRKDVLSGYPRLVELEKESKKDFNEYYSLFKEFISEIENKKS